MNHNDLLIKSILSSGGEDILPDMGEITLEAVAKSDIVDKIPEIGWIKNLYSIGSGIENSFFIKKLLLFINIKELILPLRAK